MAKSYSDETEKIRITTFIVVVKKTRKNEIKIVIIQMHLGIFDEMLICRQQKQKKNEIHKKNKSQEDNIIKTKN